MVNYCCVQGCSRNSRIHKHLNFYNMPKELHRQKQWLRLARRDDLLDKDMDKLRKTLRFCSRHFPPTSIVNRHLSQDALPTKNLPGSLDEEEPDLEPEKHEGIICDSCQDPILGFRYKCVTCDNFDLCQKCEMLENHPQHYMLRIPKSIRFQLADNLINKWRSLFKSEHVTPDCDSSSDDEPVTKYLRNYDSGIDLTEDVKNDIRKEIKRALNAELNENKKEESTVKVAKDKVPPIKKNGTTVDTLLNKKLKNDALKRKEATEDIVPKKVKINESETSSIKQTEAVQDLVFADVNELKYDGVDKKLDTPVTVPNTFVIDQTQPMLYVTLSNDLSQFMIELAPDNNSNEINVMK